jgi:hypothetical protein
MSKAVPKKNVIPDKHQWCADPGSRAGSARDPGSCGRDDNYVFVFVFVFVFVTWAGK